MPRGLLSVCVCACCLSAPPPSLFPSSHPHSPAYGSAGHVYGWAGERCLTKCTHLEFVPVFREELRYYLCSLDRYLCRYLGTSVNSCIRVRSTIMTVPQRTIVHQQSWQRKHPPQKCTFSRLKSRTATTRQLYPFSSYPIPSFAVHSITR